MVFLDETVITARSGDGGRGCVSFRREKFIPRGGPDGGDGGSGGNVIIRANKALHSLGHYKSRRHFSAQNGQPGRGRNQSGRCGPALILDVPMGTVIEDCDNGEIISDLVVDNQSVLVVSGGKGGKGNQQFASSTNRAPRIAQPGQPGKERRLRLSLKFLADIGLVGLPNAGKSTLLACLTRAHPKIDAYPFTTLAPNLGLMDLDGERLLVIADIPGLIEGASEGRGLGLRFLRHVERTRLLLHLLDITYVPQNHIIEDFDILRWEMSKYDPKITDKPYLVVINKIDLYEGRYRDLARLQKALADMGAESVPISALTGEGLETLKELISERF